MHFAPQNIRPYFSPSLLQRPVRYIAISFYVHHVESTYPLSLPLPTPAYPCLPLPLLAYSVEPMALQWL